MADPLLPELDDALLMQLARNIIVNKAPEGL